MKFLEKDLETIIWEANPHHLSDRNFHFYGNKKFRQLKIGNYGVADLVTVKYVRHPYGRYLEIDIFELKQNQINSSALFQAIRYARGIIHYLNHRRSNILARVNITLIGSSIEKKGDYLYFEAIGDRNTCGTPPYSNEIGSIDFMTYSYEINGIQFKNNTGWHLTNHGFKNRRL